MCAGAMKKSPSLTQTIYIISEETMVKIYSWFVRNPCRHNYECAEALELHVNTVSRAARAIREGWTPLSGGAAHVDSTGKLKAAQA